MKSETSLGPFLKRLRESNKLSLRQVAQRAGLSSGYLSQIEGGKRGRRKDGDYFAPHPQILQKLATVYHVEAYDLFERAGYFEEGGVSFYRGFSEEIETDRCFDFVIHDPALKEIFSLQDKRAVIDRYEEQTGRKLLSWTVSPSPMRKKATFQGLRVTDNRLYADTVDFELNVAEVAEELGMTEDEVRQLVTKKHLITRPSKGDGPPTFSRLRLMGFQAQCQYLGQQLMKALEAKDIPKTPAEFKDANRVIEEQTVERATKSLRAKSKIEKQERESSGEEKS